MIAPDSSWRTGWRRAKEASFHLHSGENLLSGGSYRNRVKGTDRRYTKRVAMRWAGTAERKQQRSLCFGLGSLDRHVVSPAWEVAEVALWLRKETNRRRSALKLCTHGLSVSSDGEIRILKAAELTLNLDSVVPMASLPPS